jgi:hypothetical protein
MGNVLRAYDSRLNREVALKVLPEEWSGDSGRLRRFEREASVISALNHPNIVTVYDVGRDPVPYIAMELIEGRTLREILRGGPLPLKRLLDVGVPVAEALARAHEAGVIHRDVKPENVIVSRDGVTKLLDFGLAKRAFSTGGTGADATVTLPTEPGSVAGTVRYMSPEQAAGREIDFRSDQFSLGSLLYEMASGRPAFSGETNIDTLSAILHGDPTPLNELDSRLPPPLCWIVERCHAKAAAERYASTADLARDLQSLRERLPNLSSASGILSARPRRSLRVARAAVAAAAALVLAGLAYWLGARRGPSSPRIRQLTLQGGAITTARFAPGGQSVVYATQWEGRRPELFEVRLEHPESRPLGLPAAQVLAISRTGYLALAVLPRFGMTLRSPSWDLVDRFPIFLTGTLSQVPISGGTPRELLENVFDADWTPDGRELAVTRFVDGRNRLEFPIGHTVRESFTWIAFPRISPDGERVAFSDAGTNLYFADRAGNVVSAGVSVWERVWLPSGELLYGEVVNGATELRILTRKGSTKTLMTLPGYVTLYDASRSGAVLLGQVNGRDDVYGSFPGEARDRRLFRDAALEDVSPAGDLVTFSSGDALDPDHSASLGKTDGTPAKRLGALGGFSRAILSPDGRFVLGMRSPDGLVVLDASKTGLALVPTGPGSIVAIPTAGLEGVQPEGISSDGQRVFLSGAEPGHGTRLWVQDLAGGRRKPATPEDVRQTIVSPDAIHAVGYARDGWTLYTIEGDGTRKLDGILPGEEPIQWTADGRDLYVRGADEAPGGDAPIPARVYRLDLRSGKRTLWKEIPPLSPTTGGGVGAILFSADGKTCFYTHHTFTAELFVIEGLR